MKRLMCILAIASAVALAQTTPQYLPRSGGTMTGPFSAPNVNTVLNASQFPGSDLGAKVNAAIASLASGAGAIIDLGNVGDTVVSTPIVIDRPIRLRGNGKAGRLVPASALSGPMIQVIKDSNSATNEFGQGIGVHLEHLWIEDTGWRTHSVDGIQILQQDQFFLNDVQVRGLKGYALELNCPTCNNTPVRESVFKDFRTWWTGDPTNSLASIIINDDPSSGDRTNDIYFSGGQVVYPLYQGIYIDTQKTTSDSAPDHIHFEDFQVEGREIISPSNTNAATAAPYDAVVLNHANRVTFTRGEISNYGQGKSAINVVGTSGNQVNYVFVNGTAIGGTSGIICTVNTSGTAVTVTSGCTLLTDGTQNGLTAVINGVSYAVSSVTSGSALTLATSAGTQSSAVMSILDGGYGISTAYMNSVANYGVQWQGNPLGNLNVDYTKTTGAYYDYGPATGGTSYAGSFVGYGAAQFGMQIGNLSGSGQIWTLGANNDGSFSIGPKTTSANMNILAPLTAYGLEASGTIHSTGVIYANSYIEAPYFVVDTYTVLPNFLTGYHGTNGTKVQLSDGTGSPGHAAVYDGFGNLSNGPALPSSFAGVVASGSLALATNAIASGGCQAVTAGSVNSAAATGVLTTDNIVFTPAGSIKAATGYTPSTNGGLTITAYPTAGYVNFDVCNWSGAAITPGPVTMNWTVVR